MRDATKWREFQLVKLVKCCYANLYTHCDSGMLNLLVECS